MENGCVFCDRSKLDERLIYENEDFYIVASLGQITDSGYVLLIPKAHIPCIAAIGKVDPVAEHLTLAKTMSQIGKALMMEYRTHAFTILEHGIVGQTIKHAHLHFLPVELHVTERVKKDFPTAEVFTTEYVAALSVSYARNPVPYLLWGVTTDPNLHVCWNPPAPSQYLRTVAAELLGRPERGNWRNMDPELDKRLCAETVARLKPYFS